MAAGCGAIALWGALATLTVVARPVPPFQMVAMTFTLGAAIGILRARRRGLSWSDLLNWPPRVWLLGVGGLFGYHALYFAALQLALDKQKRQFNEACIGKILTVLLEKPGRHNGQMVGRSPYLQSIHVAAAVERIGEIVPALISEASTNSLSGSLAEAVGA